jgi:flagellin-like protein
MKKIWAIRKDAEAVSPVIATILMVAITVVLAAVLYVMVLGFGGTSSTTPSLQITVTTDTATGGQKCSLTKPTADTSWTDVTIVLTQGGAAVATWLPASTDLDGDAFITHDYGENGGVSLNITDVGGDGYISGGDYLMLTGGSGTYNLILTHEPTDGQMAEKTVKF